MFDFIPWSQRNSEPEPRIHDELTSGARTRIAYIIQSVDVNDMEKAAVRLAELTGQVPKQIGGYPSSDDIFDFINEGESDVVLDYLELILNIILAETTDDGYVTEIKYPTDSIIQICGKIERALVQEGVLIQMKPSPKEEMTSRKWSRSDCDKIIFQPLSDETIINADQELRVLGLGDTWKEPLEGYNEAWRLYKDGIHTSAVAEKLYNSLEAVCQKICVDLEGWASENDTVGTYLDEIREHDLFKPNPAMVGEWQQIMTGLRIGVQRTGSDRKDHENLDQDYLILLLHQTSAFLTFVIKRYEQNEHSD